MENITVILVVNYSTISVYNATSLLKSVFVKPHYCWILNKIFLWEQTKHLICFDQIMMIIITRLKSENQNN